LNAITIAMTSFLGNKWGITSATQSLNAQTRTQTAELWNVSTTTPNGSVVDEYLVKSLGRDFFVN